MSKTERIDLRVSPETKDMIKMKAAELGKNTTEYLYSLVEKDLKSITHEQLIQNSLYENEFISGLLTSSELSTKSKQHIGKELRKYV